VAKPATCLCGVSEPGGGEGPAPPRSETSLGLVEQSHGVQHLNARRSWTRWPRASRSRPLTPARTHVRVDLRADRKSPTRGGARWNVAEALIAHTCHPLTPAANWYPLGTIRQSDTSHEQEGPRASRVLATPINAESHGLPRLSGVMARWSARPLRDCRLSGRPPGGPARAKNAIDRTACCRAGGSGCRTHYSTRHPQTCSPRAKSAQPWVVHPCARPSLRAAFLGNLNRLCRPCPAPPRGRGTYCARREFSLAVRRALW